MTDKMIGRGAKFRIMELYSESDLWNYEAVEKISSERNQTSRFMKNSFNFDLIELHASGFLDEVEVDVDVEGDKWGAGRVITKYHISELGKAEYEWMCN